ncbi:SPOC like C-terminal domain-containing protein [Tuber borchii]|uniref:ATP-dependent DNA helicase II subunit 2 n=1 Tax=Tuber borchii TaxID=42251 RepID=A0A2T6ZYC0_TUBBO|nr:SPOC like C-terminal domain-containing protein [Tuber borchii]
MADKQATVYVIDLGPTLSRVRPPRGESDLDYALTYIWDKITATMSTGRKTDVVGVVGFRTENTDNTMATADGYENICVLAPIGQFLMDHVRDLKRALVPSRRKGKGGDGFSAICIAVDMIMKYCRRLKYIRNVVLVTDGRGEWDDEGCEEIVRQIQEEGINLTVLGVDFDDEEYGFAEEGKDPRKARNEKVIKKVVEACNEGDQELGVFGTLAEAIYELGKPRLKKVRPVASFRGELTLGNLETYDTAFSINVERYPRTAIAKPISASSYTAKTEKPGSGGSVSGDGSVSGGVDLQAVKNARAYQIEDDAAAGGMMDIEKDQMEKGYNYGRTVVPISATDETITVLETEPGLQIVGFVPVEKYRRYFSMSTTNVIVGAKDNPKASMALSSLIHALFELESYALTRLVTKKNVAPVLVLLAPFIDADYECLIDVQVPFAEDMRHYKFPPLNRVRTISGKVLEKHRFLPTPDMEKLMSDYVDKMDLMTANNDEDEPEYATVDETFSPVLHRVNQVVRWRAVHPDEPLPPVHEILTKYDHSPENLLEASTDTLKKLIEASDVKKVDPKVAGRKRGRERPVPKSGLDVEALLTSAAASSAPKKAKISSTNPIPDFKNKLRTTEDLSDLEEAGKEMLAVLKELIKYSLADANYGRVCEILKVMREEYIEYDEPGMYNEVVQGLKKAIVSGELDGDRMECWDEIRYNKLGLITKGESERVEVDDAEARKFLWG